MEPSRETLEEMGRLCGAWAYFERLSEQALWGVIGANDDLGGIISSKLDMRSLWQLLMSEGEKRLKHPDFEELKTINRDLIAVMRDRNIIIHGQVHAALRERKPTGHYSVIGPTDQNYDFARVPCWTVFKGAPAGKSYPVSTQAVRIVRTNVQLLADRLEAFNSRFGHFKAREPSEDVEKGWPVALANRDDRLRP